MPDDLDPSRPDEASRESELLERVVQLETALRSRPAIEQAKGMIMVVHRCDDEQAFRVLIAVSQSCNRKLREVAAEIVTALPVDKPLPPDIAVAFDNEVRRLQAGERRALGS
ncbi:ANTAR domain-containing protein [Pseudonocardia sp. RS11V-5]|uniref:ANTAR domain-containing protein n=1 Tax=Pseudonocardia terrae TaxID=2905831 RepID=UPI001E2BD0FF|nr:ANTAR domain-containing protein [Pseudonocardia terrae]MCE3552441.1 ANTAR domain-containing protein [Pseudonocardia terrae]